MNNMTQSKRETREKRVSCHRSHTEFMNDSGCMSPRPSSISTGGGSMLGSIEQVRRFRKPLRMKFIRHRDIIIADTQYQAGVERISVLHHSEVWSYRQAYLVIKGESSGSKHINL